ncbi:glutamine--fructose-6-phosphate transaminase (isomerizing) [Candidatus Falkowbacteria bacterium CG_4_10_14_0_2_um_filter_48_10]|uniref:Glutamine--fructose-6-phosphate aminotransferase [isomerizing] n=1 Tax=Candidatus Falkowbacteria bacterium CG23_combo_of_CG06-09_8_20_14_all_49_15 TaxID=1974572 RepID=A0A2G9ZLL8_9BACT|nr:MAG: glutamine--fructose-6-phosphate transaminase (isomerizing) [Candidatus Falkowbacteria bacterium CG23_combo_of_CG06-09_8_20_14_all_49_15]PJA09107.1 MAG: glutamine--fructose-6-phosphate transaminase (isomerizing) [Candidatus Falkowbacteria bacterium CG_4_10_14_0_2_um_filter_48_10]
MCGIIAYVGDQPAQPIILSGLRALEYRGYDSAGFVVRENGQWRRWRASGPVAALAAKMNGASIRSGCGLGHTRWATHGAPTEVNAHPHAGGQDEVMLVHNGIVENFSRLKKKLAMVGTVFVSETDTEVLAHLIALCYAGDLVSAVAEAMSRTEGPLGIAVMHRARPDEIVVARRGSPMLLGLTDRGRLAASDAAAFAGWTDQVIYLADNEIARLTADSHQVFDARSARVDKVVTTISPAETAAELNGFPHFMRKEIYEQAETAASAWRGRLDPVTGAVKLGGLLDCQERLKNCSELIIAACGTSYYAGLYGQYLLSESAGLDARAEIASEFRYCQRSYPAAAALLAISQSGETADTLAAVRLAQAQGLLSLGLVNVAGSTLARETAAGVYNHAGPEIGVASTKIFLSQLAIFNLLALFWRQLHGRDRAEDLAWAQALVGLPDKIRQVLALDNRIAAIAERFCHYPNWLFLGRHFNYPVALEGALKLKEVSYIHAEGYAAGEMKHGPIALVSPEVPTVAIAPADRLRAKMIGNIMEVKSRRGPVIAIITAGDEEIKELADEAIEIPPTLDWLYPLLAVIPGQLLAYHAACLLGRNVDRPRNLAKSVTVE